MNYLIKITVFHKDCRDSHLVREVHRGPKKLRKGARSKNTVPESYGRGRDCMIGLAAHKGHLDITFSIFWSFWLLSRLAFFTVFLVPLAGYHTVGDRK